MWLQGFVIIQDISKRLFVPCVVGKVWFGAQATVNILYMLSKTVVTNIKCVLVCCMPVCRFVNSRALRSEPSSCSCMCRGCRSHHLHWDATQAKKTEKCTLTFQRAEETLIHGGFNKYSTVSVVTAGKNSMVYWKSSTRTWGRNKCGSFHLKQEHLCFWEFGGGRSVLWLNLKVW